MSLRDEDSDPFKWLTTNLTVASTEVAFTATMNACARSSDPGEIKPPTRIIDTTQRPPADPLEPAESLLQIPL